MDKTKISIFEDIVSLIKNDRIIEDKNLYSFKLIARVIPFSYAQEMHKISRTKISLSNEFSYYDKPYLFLKSLLKKEEIPISDLYKYFVDIQYEVLNSNGIKASGGERSEYNLLQELVDAARCDILLLDEPESSFDNLFLKDGVNALLKELSKQIPVVIATHNNTIGASVRPDYLIYTRKDILDSGEVKFNTFSGYPSSTELFDNDGNSINRKDVMLDCLEAGEQAYNERRESYEISYN